MSAAFEELIHHDKKFNDSAGSDIARASRAIIRKYVHGWDVMELVEELTWAEWHSIKQYIGTVNFSRDGGKGKIGRAHV